MKWNTFQKKPTQKKGPKNDSKYEWTEHSKFKMQYYGLSSQRVLRVIRNPHRIETGIVENTIAVMQPGGNVRKCSKGESADKKTWNSEIWVMYQVKNNEKKQELKDKNVSKSDNKNVDFDFDAAWEKFDSRLNLNKKIRIISAWRYPGVTDENDPIPAEILREIEDII